MMRTIAAALILAGLVGLYVTNVGVLVWRTSVRDLGEGGPSFDCYFLGAMGPVRVGYFYSADPEAKRMNPAPRADCPRACLLEKHTIKIGAREIRAWKCTNETTPATPDDQPQAGREALQ